MRKFLIPLAAAASTVAVAAPAAAQQWYPQPQAQVYVYGHQQPYQPYGNAYGYNNPYQQPYGNAYGYGYAQPQGYAYGYQNPYQQPYGRAYGYHGANQARAVANRINRIQNDLRILANQRMISRNEYRNRLQDSREIERRFYRNARDGRGLSQSEMYDVQVRVARLEQRIARDMRDGRRFGYRW